MTPSEPRVPLFKPFSHFTGRRVFLGSIAFPGLISSSETMVPLDTASPRELVRGTHGPCTLLCAYPYPGGLPAFQGLCPPCDTGARVLGSRGPWILQGGGDDYRS